MRSGPVGRALIGAVKLYRALPRSRLPSCRFDPTCSQYVLDAVRTWGAARGGWLALRRICRCHPWGGWGYDPVPERSDRIYGAGHAAGSVLAAPEPGKH
ncbi:membrane protein insertion efficiency factor YidD [Candidatus Poriferisodalis sp.]|uniref:membrane protein insertion efficiency factor YidD n=1 Tax=Candidatus Poriferisodalis sp. TaxID=3101277 RepID=UPI003B02E13C